MPNTKTGIEWTDATWSPTIGCTRVSSGCDHCYAFTLHDQRHEAWKSGRWPEAPAQYHQPFSVVQLMPERLEVPLRWTKPRRIFVDSMADLFHPEVPTQFIDQVFGVMAGARRHTFQVLTKRPQRMMKYLSDVETKRRIWHAGRPTVERILHKDMYDAVPIPMEGRAKGPDWCYPATWPLPNVWIGTSVEDAEAAYRVDFLVKTPAAVRFLSCEPLVGPINLEPWLWQEYVKDDTGATAFEPRGALHWVIVGGESGPGHRPIDPAWVRQLRGDCVDAGVAYFFKQWGGPSAKAGGRELDGRTWSEFPNA